jgi:hypothetical protein
MEFVLREKLNGGSTARGGAGRGGDSGDWSDRLNSGGSRRERRAQQSTFVCHQLIESESWADEDSSDAIFAGRSDGETVVFRQGEKQYGGGRRKERTERRLAGHSPHKGTITCMCELRMRFIIIITQEEGGELIPHTDRNSGNPIPYYHPSSSFVSIR